MTGSLPSTVVLQLAVQPAVVAASPVEGQGVRLRIAASDGVTRAPIGAAGLRVLVGRPGAAVPTAYDQAQMTEVATGQWTLAEAASYDPPPAALREGEVEVSAAQHANWQLQRLQAGEVIEVPPPPPPPIRRIAPLALRRRLSSARRTALTLAASQAMEAGDATLQAWLDDLAASRFVDLDATETIAGVSAALAAGVITEAERDALLADGTADEAA